MGEVEGYEAPIGDPHNDQIAAASEEQLNFLLKSTRSLREQAVAQNGGHDNSSMMAIIAVSLENAGWPQIKMASVLAAALLRLTKDDLKLDTFEAIEKFLEDPSIGVAKKRPDDAEEREGLD